MNKYADFVYTNKIKEERVKKGYTYKEMANFLGLKSRTAYYNIEVGIVEPKISQMCQIAKILKKSVSYFFNFKVQ